MTTQPMQSIGELLEAYQAAITRAEAAEARLATCMDERDKLMRLLAGEGVELKCEKPGYHAVVRLDVEGVKR